MKIFTRGLGFVEFNKQIMNWVKFNGQLVYEAFKKLLVSGIPPLTLLKSKGVDLVDYKIYGNSMQDILLPSDYQQVEYIESTGTQYIDSGVPLKSGLKIIVDWIYKDADSGNSYTGGHIGSPGNRWLLGSQRGDYYAFAVGINNNFTEFVYGNRDIVEACWKNKGSYIIVNGVKTTKTHFENVALVDEPNYTFYMGAVNRDGNATLNPKLTIYSWKFYQDDVLIRDFIPCYRKSDNVIGMYDLVTGTFYTNKGTGTFLKGNGIISPDNPIEVESVGEKTKNLWGEETAVISSTTGLSYKWDNYGCYVTNTGTITKEVGFTMKLPAGNYSIYCKDFRLYINKNGSLVVTNKNFSTINGTEEFEIKLRSFLNSESTAYYKISVIEGTYTEDTMPEYEPYGYRIPVRVRGKNLFNFDNLVNTSAIIKNEDGSITVSGYPAGTTKKLRELCPELQVGQTIIFSMITNGYSQIYLNNLTTGKNTYWNNKNSYVITEDLLGSSIYFYRQTSAQGGGPATISNIQIELGDTLTDHEPYVEPITTNIYLDEPLIKMGDYADYIDFKNQKVIRNVANKIFDGTENWEIHATTKEGKVFRLDGALNPLIGASINDTYMTHFSLTDIYSTATFTNGLYRFGFNQNNLTISSNRLYVSAEQTTVEDFKNWLAENKPSIYYPITELPENVDLPSIPTIKGTTVIEVDTNIQPSNMGVEYLGKK